MKLNLPKADLEGLSAGGCTLLPFWVIFVVLLWRTPFQPEQMEVADPIIQAIDAAVNLYAIPIFSLIVCAVLWTFQPPTRVPLGSAVRLGVLGALLAFAFLLFLKLVFGEMPPFIPPEESAKPGLLLGFGAGILEEALFRLAILPLIYRLLSQRWNRTPAMGGAILLTGLLFALAHEIGPGAGPFRWDFFLARFLLPGSFMSLLFFWPGPPFVLSLHCTAHLVIPSLFN